MGVACNGATKPDGGFISPIEKVRTVVEVSVGIYTKNKTSRRDYVPHFSQEGARSDWSRPDPDVGEHSFIACHLNRMGMDKPHAMSFVGVSTE